MNKSLGIGVVGLGWAGQTAIKAFLQQPNVEVVAIADSEVERLAQVSKQFNIATTFSDYNELLQHAAIDIVVCAAPNFLHAPIVAGALEHGKHVLTEKPLARNYEEGAAMVEAAIKHNRVLEMVTNHRRADDVRLLKQLIDEGRLGRIYHAKSYWLRRQGIPGFGGWFTTMNQSGGGPMIDLGVHMLDMALFLMNDPQPVSVSAAAYFEHGKLGKGSWNDIQQGHHDVEDFATAIIRMADGATLLLEASWETYIGHRDLKGIELFGTEGGSKIIHDSNSGRSFCVFTDMAGRPTTIEPRIRHDINGHQEVVREFLDVVRSGNWDAHHGHSALKRTHIIDACYESARSGREIRFD
jgi:predicted dehydrogenase